MLEKRSLFVVTGVPKSGTTWAHLLCDAHPEVRCYGEDDFNQFLPQIADAMNQYNRSSADRNRHLPSGKYARFSEGDLERIASVCIAIMLTEGGIPPVTKALGTKFNDMLTNNTRAYGEIFRNARIIHVLRDPRDALVSVFHHNHRVNPEFANKKWPRLLDVINDIGAVYAESIRNGLAIGDDHTGNYHEVRYEDLSRDPQRIARDMFEFLGVDTTGPVIKECCRATTFEKLSGGRRRGEEDRSSFMRKGSVGDWRQAFDDDCLAALEKTGIRDIVIELGYDFPNSG